MTGTFDRTTLVILGAALAALWLAFGAARADAAVSAGAAKVDASWHVGASAGQYASDGSFIEPADGTYDPTAHSTRRRSSYGLQSRLEARAIVIKDSDSAPVAIVKTDLYIPQDLLYRRAAQLLETDPRYNACGVTRESLTMAVTHNHSSPMYSSTAWGVWAFQDVFDIRFYNYMAERIAMAVTDACDELAPVRVGASVGTFDLTHRHSFGPSIADDGTPAGYPNSETDHDMTVIRFDDAATGEPVANLVNFSLHPEFLEGNDLISADYIGPLERMTDRETKALTIWTQGAVGTAEPERSTYHDPSERLEFTHRDYAQAEYGASLMSAKLVDIWNDIAANTPDAEHAHRFVPFAIDFPVAMQDQWYPGPLSHPYPGVSNCRADKAIGGDPQLPIVGLPDCTGVENGLNSLSDLTGLPEAPDIPGYPADTGLTTDDFQEAGIPVPENYSAPAYTGLEEDIDVHLQGIRLGEIYLPVCSCEQWFDQSKNIETRTDRVIGNEWLGYDWGAQCTPNDDGTYVAFGDPGEDGTGTWSCPNPGNPASSLPEVSDHKYRRMRAQVLNPANGWNDPLYVLEAESEPFDTTEIKGNYTQDDDGASAALGYTLTVPIAMANDYNGYIATYREYQRGDHYRKALTGWGPHASDYMATRLVTIGRQLRDADAPLPGDQALEKQFLSAKVEADQAVNDARATALGEVGTRAIEQYEAALPDDGGGEGPVEQPEDIERFDTAFFTWNGGSNYTDSPEVKVQRNVDGEWVEYADQSGEIPITVQYPSGPESIPFYLQGDQEWHWTAHFEAFVAPFDVGTETRETPAGEYRFVVDGERREDAAEGAYRVVSDTFEVKPWDGITVGGLEENDGLVSVKAGSEDSPFDSNGAVGPIDYPDSYDGDKKARFIRWERETLNGGQQYCFTCSFRPWLDAGDAETVQFTFADASGAFDAVAATRVGDRWVSERPLAEGETAFVDAGCVEDEYGNVNGSGSADAVGASSQVPSESPGCVDTPAPDTTPPDTRIDSGPAEGSSTLETVATFAYSGDPVADTARFECSLDGAAFADCAAVGVSYTGLAAGDHEFAVRAIDAAGNADQSPATRAWIVQTPSGGDPGGGDTGGGGGSGGDGSGGDDGSGNGGDGGANPLPSPGPSPVVCERGTRRDEKLKGTRAGDCLAGGRGDDQLRGRGGDDRLIGGPGNDLIVGGPGADAINCGAGRDDVARVDGADEVKGCETIKGRA